MRTTTVLCVLLFAVMLTGSGYAKIEPEVIAGIWLFGEGQGKTIRDSSGNGHHGNIGSPNWVEGKIGKALEIHDSPVVVPHTDQLSLLTYTVMAWVKVPEVTRDHQSALVKGVWPAVDYMLALGKGKPVIACGGVFMASASGLEEAVDNEWHHIAGTVDSDNAQITMYVDGVLTEQAGIQAGWGPVLVDTELFIGGHPDNDPLDGTVDEVGIFNVVLTEDDIETIVNDGLREATGVIAVSSAGKLTITWAGIKTSI